ncbi:diaminopimelate decarboxylase [Microterricola pindariensis]|uniref:Diaminopimelate decarboxylase n=1 Tax=Microterricola pindariensis TaxID=478010 RepID=A0ABX5AV19_9MICO|nr:diaminopimelate decarboxylase [Microterricola pindariensis]PPL18796.1 diaminopimelate decarboxylase [Microterricola pindariensis]
MANFALAPDWLAVPVQPNALNPAIWPAHAERTDAGEISIAGVPARALAAEFGTPLYVFDEEDVRSRAIQMRETFEAAFAAIGTTVSVYYAGKAFLSTAVVGWVRDAGLRVDICSGGELAVALAGGAPASELGFHGNNKSVAEIDRAVALGLGTIVIDSSIEIERVAAAAARLGRVQAVRLRVNSGVHAHTHEFLATAHEDQKFGITLADAPAVVAAIRAHDSLDFRGLHCHIGSQIFDAAGFAESAARLLTLQAELLAGGPVPELNLGGGFGIAYTEADSPAAIEDIARGMAAAVGEQCARLGIPVPHIAIEPGRSIVGNAGVTLYEVGTTKQVSVPDAGGADADNTRLYVSVDGGMSDNARPALYGADYTVRVANRASEAPVRLVRVAGKHCESGDIVVDADYLPSDVTPGDLLAVAATGAYCFSLSNNYNYLTRPPVVAVKAGAARLIVRGETEADLLARDLGAAGSTVQETAR